MLDIQLIRREPDAVRAALARRSAEAAAAVDRVLELDQRWREIRTALEELKAEQNRASRGRKGPPTPEEREQLASLAARGRELSDEETAVRAELDAQLTSLPNLPAPDAPDEDTVLREVGEAGATGRDHLELAGPRIDMERAARLSGSRFAYLRGDLVMLEFALVRYALEKLRREGFEPVIPPVLVRERALYGTGFLPDTEQQIYRLPEDDLYLVGTSEVALASLHDDEILAHADLPRALRRVLDLLSPRGGRRRQGHPRHLPGAPVRQGRDVQLRRARGGGGRARAAAGDRGVDPQRARDPLPGGGDRGRRPGRLSGQEVRLRGMAAGPGPLPRADLDLEHDRLPVPPARDPLPARATAVRSTSTP